ncbi:uncharacterized protein VNE69_01045 [Vairimorpha necatrix]|uniref:Uncharacterized protein n=1 Tax=Vairimorpha necatrix TaxID=6039 RepID=A0AAX4J7W8_9MICR
MRNYLIRYYINDIIVIKCLNEEYTIMCKETEKIKRGRVLIKMKAEYKISHNLIFDDLIFDNDVLVIEINEDKENDYNLIVKKLK